MPKHKTFFREIDTSSRKDMIDFLENHFRYNTMNSWNQSTSYANNLKVHHLNLDSKTANKLHDLIDCENFYDSINDLIRDFDYDHDHLWQAGFNGRSGGYLVLYQGESVPSGHKSRCTSCGQLNFKTVAETGGNACGRCGENSRVDLTKPIMNHGVFPGKSTDIAI